MQGDEPDLGIIAKGEPSAAIKAPPWIAWYLNYAIKGKTPREQRKQIAVNSFALFNGVYCLLWVLFYIAYDLDLWPLILVVAIIAAQNFAMPFGWRAGQAYAVVLFVVVGAANLLVQTWMLGYGSGVPLFFFVFPVSVLVVSGPDRLDQLCFVTALSIACFLFSAYALEEPALEAARDEVLQTVLFVFIASWVAILTMISAFVAFKDAERAEDALEREHARSEALLYNLLPGGIANRLKDAPDRTIADSLPRTAILFADIVDFTPRSRQMPAEELVKFLNDVFSHFDGLSARHGLEKIKTIGDAYMAAAGLPEPCDDPVHRAAEMALDMRDSAAAMADGVQLRIGLHAGPAVAGVIGSQKLFYDVWGDTVNTASRMESHGDPGGIQVTETAYAALQYAYEFEERGEIDVKGIGSIRTWWLLGRK